ncbi:hypothetical protein quinque_007231 [Culex quinquefasciatus]
MTSTCCRLCLLNGSDLQPILDLTVESNRTSEPVAPSLSQLIVRYLSIEPLLENTITTYVCSDCRNTIAKWHWFRESCLQNDGVYQKMAQDPGKDDAPDAQLDEYYEIVVKQEQDEVEVEEQKFSESLFTEQLDAIPKEKPKKKGRPKKVATQKKSQPGGEPPVKKKIGRPKLPEGERKPIRAQMCTLCGKLVMNMGCHLKMHNQDRCYQCPHCPKTFYSSSNWKNHVNIHTKEVKFTCPVCDKCFWRNETLKMHMKSHSEERTFKCPYCPKAYRMRPGLVNHRKTHTQAPNIQCTGCEKKFYDKTQMEKHAVKHLAVKPYACTVCERGFTRKYYLAAHMEKHHPNGKEETETNTSAVADEIDGEDIFDD